MQFLFIDLETTQVRNDCADETSSNLTDRLSSPADLVKLKRPRLEAVTKQRLVRTEKTLCVL
jgi:hypothetical protein